MISEGARISIDTGMLTMLQNPLPTFMHALGLGEKEYAKEKEAKASRQWEYDQASQPSGHWVWVEDE